MVSDALIKSVNRLSWFGDKALVEAEAAVAGAKLATDIPFYTPLNGIFKQLFALISASKLTNRTIEATAEATFKGLFNNADSRLRSESGKMILVTRDLFDKYADELRAKSQLFTLDYTVDGLPKINWNGIPVINMENVWDIYIPDFVENTTTNKVLYPSRAILTVPTNIPIATLNENDMAELESFWYQKDRVNITSYGYTLDAKVLEPKMIEVAFGG